MSALVLYTAAEVADLLRLNHQVVQRKLQAGEIPGYRIGREWRVEEGQLRQWLESRSNQHPRDATSSFFTSDGRLTALPASRQKRASVLRRLVEAFEAERTYRERDVNAVIRRFHDDVATIRRELISAKLLVRSREGVYKRTGPRQGAIHRA